MSKQRIVEELTWLMLEIVNIVSTIIYNKPVLLGMWISITIIRTTSLIIDRIQEKK